MSVTDPGPEPGKPDPDPPASSSSAEQEIGAELDKLQAAVDAVKDHVATHLEELKAELQSGVPVNVDVIVQRIDTIIATVGAIDPEELG